MTSICHYTSYILIFEISFLKRKKKEHTKTKRHPMILSISINKIILKIQRFSLPLKLTPIYNEQLTLWRELTCIYRNKTLCQSLHPPGKIICKIRKSESYILFLFLQIKLGVAKHNSPKKN